MVARVLDAKEWCARTPVTLLPNGNQVVLIKVASDEGGFVVPTLAGAGGKPLAPGDLVIWVPMGYDDSVSGDQSSWIGIIRAKIEPAEGPNWGANYKIICKYPRLLDPKEMRS
jgi:hypothetical protein